MFSEFINFNVETVSGSMLLIAFAFFMFLVVYRIAPQVYQALISTKAQDLKTLRQAVGEERELFCVITSDTAQATDAIDILATSAAWKFIDRTLSAAEVLARFNTTKAQYGF
jgi:hypothetical protein